jgi:hypothetical protein
MNLTPISIHMLGQVRLAGDYNQNGVVDTADYVRWRKGLGQAVTAFSEADGDGDGSIDSGDYDIWRAHFGRTTAGGASAHDTAGMPSSENLAIPEPAAFVLVFIGAALLPTRRAASLVRQLDLLPKRHRFEIARCALRFFAF